MNLIDQELLLGKKIQNQRINLLVTALACPKVELKVLAQDAKTKTKKFMLRNKRIRH